MESWETTPEHKLPGLAVYNVNDSPCPPGPVSLNRAGKSLPGNLSLQVSRAAMEDTNVLGVYARDIIPKGTKFGPMIGEVFRPEEVLEAQDKRYFWRVYDLAAERILFYIDGKDTNKTNWMRHVQPAFKKESQNLVAYQEGNQVR